MPYQSRRFGSIVEVRSCPWTSTWLELMPLSLLMLFSFDRRLARVHLSVSPGSIRRRQLEWLRVLTGPRFHPDAIFLQQIIERRFQALHLKLFGHAHILSLVFSWPRNALWGRHTVSAMPAGKRFHGVLSQYSIEPVSSICYRPLVPVHPEEGLGRRITEKTENTYISHAILRISTDCIGRNLRIHSRCVPCWQAYIKGGVRPDTVTHLTGPFAGWNQYHCPIAI